MMRENNPNKKRSFDSANIHEESTPKRARTDSTVASEITPEINVNYQYFTPQAGVNFLDSPQIIYTAQMSTPPNFVPSLVDDSATDEGSENDDFQTPVNNIFLPSQVRRVLSFSSSDDGEVEDNFITPENQNTPGIMPDQPTLNIHLRQFMRSIANNRVSLIDRLLAVEQESPVSPQPVRNRNRRVRSHLTDDCEPKNLLGKFNDGNPPSPSFKP